MIWFIIMGLVGLSALGWQRAEKKEEIWVGFLTVCLVLISATTLVLASGFAISNASGLAKWKAFAEANSANYAYTQSATASYLSTEKFTNTLIDGSIEKMQLASSVSERLKEWRDSINEYNETIASMKYWDSNVITGVLVPDGVQNMPLLKMAP